MHIQCAILSTLCRFDNIYHEQRRELDTERSERAFAVWTVPVPVELPHGRPAWFLQRMRQGLDILFVKGFDSGESDRKGKFRSQGYSWAWGLNGEHLKLTPPGLRARSVPKEGHETAAGASVTPPANSALTPSIAPPQLPSLELVWSLSTHICRAQRRYRLNSPI